MTTRTIAKKKVKTVQTIGKCQITETLLLIAPSNTQSEVKKLMALYIPGQ